MGISVTSTIVSTALSSNKYPIVSTFDPPNYIPGLRTMLLEDCRLILDKPFDEKNVLVEGFRTLLGQGSNGGGDENSKKYKIIEIDRTELSISELLKKYFFSGNHHTSCSFILQKSRNSTIEHYSIVDDKQTKDFEKENTEIPANKVKNDKTNNNSISSTFSTYKYTKEDIDNFFVSDNGQGEDHTLEESICRPLIGIQNYKPFFKYCKICPKVEFQSLISIENHIRLKDPEKHKAKLLELLEKEEKKDSG
jgi:hypothetical protein